MINLDGADLDMGGREFAYDVPAPFGPDRGPAVLKVKARPMASVNAGFRAALELVMHNAKVKDRIADDMFEASKDYDAYYRAQSENGKWVDREIAQLNYDHCIVEWSTTIQSKGADIVANRDNFIELALFQHVSMVSLFRKLRADLADLDKFSLDAVKAEGEAEIKN